MSLRNVINIIKPSAHKMGPLTYYQPIPSAMAEQIDPFLLLHHHGPVIFPAHNEGLPFGPHPHKGFETVTFIYKGDVQHKDSTGFNSTIKTGGIQWMTAGRGIVHSEKSSAEFMEKGGELELIQLWINLPARLKNSPADYQGLQEEQLAHITEAQGSLQLDIVSGTWSGTTGHVRPLTDVGLATLTLKAGAIYKASIAAEKNILCYQLAGKTKVNDKIIDGHALVMFDNVADDIIITALVDSKLLLGYAQPIGEPVVSYGPFVMNTSQEIEQAIREYQAGKMGIVNE